MLTRPARRYGRGIRSSGKLRQVVGYAQGLQGQHGDAHIVTLHDGRLTSTCVDRDRSEALEAAGLHG